MLELCSPSQDTACVGETYVFSGRGSMLYCDSREPRGHSSQIQPPVELSSVFLLMFCLLLNKKHLVPVLIAASLPCLGVPSSASPIVRSSFGHVGPAWYPLPFLSRSFLLVRSACLELTSRSIHHSFHPRLEGGTLHLVNFLHNFNWSLIYTNHTLKVQLRVC